LTVWWQTVAECVKIEVGENVCYIYLNKGRKIKHTKELPYRGPQGELLTVDLDENDQVLGIEIVGGQPCMRVEE
jgi:uncharacterized protein YuzE